MPRSCWGPLLVLALLCLGGCARSLPRGDDDYVATFVRVSAALSQGNLAAARDGTRELRRLDPDAVEGSLLGALIDRREAHAGETWVDSLAEARKAIGGVPKDSFKHATLNRAFAERTALSAPESATVRAAGKPTELLLAATVGEPSAHRVLELVVAHSSRRTPAAIRAVAFGLFPLAACASPTDAATKLCKQADTQRRMLAVDLSRAYPNALLFPLAATLEGVDATRPPSTALLDRLERAARRTRLTPRVELYEAVRDALRELGVAQPEFAATTQAGHLDSLPAIPLVLKLDALARSARPAQRARVQRILRECARALLGEKTFISSAHAARLLRTGAQLTKDDSGEDVARVIELQGVRLMNDVGDLSHVELWPIAPLEKELAQAKIRDELGLYNRLVGVAAPPDLAALIPRN